MPIAPVESSATVQTRRMTAPKEGPARVELPLTVDGGKGLNVAVALSTALSSSNRVGGAWLGVGEADCGGGGGGRGGRGGEINTPTPHAPQAFSPPLTTTTASDQIDLLEPPANAGLRRANNTASNLARVRRDSG